MSKRNICLFLNDISESIIAIRSYTENINFVLFVNDRKTYNATIREFEIIGEAVKSIPDKILLIYPQVQWRDIIDFRNLLIHAYFGVDFEIVWNVIKNDLDTLEATICKIKSDNYC